MESKEEKVISPSQYFDYLKGSKNNITTQSLKDSYQVFMKLAEKYKRLGQVKSLEKLCFLAHTLIKEEKLIEMGITTYVYKDTIEDYIEHVADKTVKIVELSRYMREVPDELVSTVEKTKELFDEFYVIFTDYTGKEERKIEKERRDKDPILFGVFKNRTNVADRFYFIGDWVDEYCDLTLDKMIENYKEKKGCSPAFTTSIPKNGEELLTLLQTYKIEDDKRVTINTNEGQTLPVSAFMAVSNISEIRPSFFKRVRNMLKS